MVYKLANGHEVEVEMYHLLSVKEQIQIKEWIDTLNEKKSEYLTFQKDEEIGFVMIMPTKKGGTLFFKGLLENARGNIKHESLRAIYIED